MLCLCAICDMLFSNCISKNIKIQGLFKKTLVAHRKHRPFTKGCLKGLTFFPQKKTILKGHYIFPTINFQGVMLFSEGGKQIAKKVPSFSSTPASSRVIEVDTKKSWAKAVVTLFLGGFLVEISAELFFCLVFFLVLVSGKDSIFEQKDIASNHPSPKMWVKLKYLALE